MCTPLLALSLYGHVCARVEIVDVHGIRVLSVACRLSLRPSLSLSFSLSSLHITGAISLGSIPLVCDDDLHERPSSFHDDSSSERQASGACVPMAL